MAVLQAFFDESGKFHDKTAVSFAGCIGFRKDIEYLSDRWTRVLNDNCVAYISTSEAMCYRNEFRGWTTREAERDELLLSLAKIGRQYLCGFIGWSMTSEKFRSLPEFQRFGLTDPAYMGFEACVNVAVDQAQKNSRHVVDFYCDLSEQYSNKCVTLFNKIRVRRPDVKRVIRSITFADETQFPPLQLADMYAYCMRELESGSTKPLILEILNQFGYRPDKRQLYECTWTRELGVMDNRRLM